MKKLTREEKIEIMKKILKEADSTANFEKAKKEFEKILKNTDADEIASMEQSLISEGYHVEKMQNLCDLHVSVFESSIKKQSAPHKIAGHPLHTFIAENKELKKKLKNLIRLIDKLKHTKDKNKDELINTIKKEFDSIKEIDKHYLRKENQLFPYLEKKGFTGPSKVMWAKDDEIREQIREISSFLNNNYKFLDQEIKKLNMMIKKLKTDMLSMIFKEEKILFPVSARKISEEEWLEIKNGESHIGYSWIIPGSLWDAYAIKKLKLKSKNIERKEGQFTKKGEGLNLNNKEKSYSYNSNEKIKLDTGYLNLVQLNFMLKNLPVDISFIDENDRVSYYSDNKERIFPRSPAVIGREVQNCHPQKSLDKVNKIIESFKKGEKDSFDFWIDLHGRFIYIRYFAVRDEKGNYLGTLEVSQDITKIRELEGEKRLLD